VVPARADSLEHIGATLLIPAFMVDGIHVFAFDQIHQSEQGRKAVLATMAPEACSQLRAGR